MNSILRAILLSCVKIWADFGIQNRVSLFSRSSAPITRAPGEIKLSSRGLHPHIQNLDSSPLDRSDSLFPSERQGIGQDNDDEEQTFKNYSNQTRYFIAAIIADEGTSSICDEHTHEPLLSNLSLIVETSVRLRREGHRVIIVSSGAIGIGLKRMDMEKKPKRLATVQVNGPCC